MRSQASSDRSEADIHIAHEATDHRHSYNIHRVLVLGGDYLDRGATGGMVIRHGPPSDFGPYHAVAVVWKAGQGNEDILIDASQQLPSSPVGPAEVAWAIRTKA